VKDHDETIKKLREVCDQADALRKTAEDLCKNLTEQIQELRAADRPARPSRRKRH
jgi:hypothetical protein